MANTIKLNFWIHRSKRNANNLIPLMVRLSYQGKRIERASGYQIDETKWNALKQRVRGDTEINAWIEAKIAKVAALFNAAILHNKAVYLPEVMEQLFPKSIEEPLLLRFIDEHNRSLKERVGKDYTFSTYEKYVFTYNKVSSYLHQELKRSDIPLKDLTVKFIMGFDHYLRVKENNQHNTAVKYCLNLKRIINVAIIQGLLAQNPFRVFKTSYKDTPGYWIEKADIQPGAAFCQLWVAGARGAHIFPYALDVPSQKTGAMVIAPVQVI